MITKWKNDLVRFGIEFGPQSLFDRVYFKMKDVHSLNLKAEHFNERKTERNIPQEVLYKLEHFDINEWTLKTAEVRRDRGKFYNSTWEYKFNGVSYWATIGIGQTVTTIVIKSSSGLAKCVTGGEYYDYVEKINKELMKSELEQ